MIISSSRLSRRVLAAALAAGFLVSGCTGGSSGKSAASSSTAAATTSAAAATPDDSAAAAAFPVTVDSGQGAVTIASQPKAIVSLSPTATEVLFAVGAGDQVKAVDDNSDYPTTAPKTKLSGFQPNVEAILAMHPDLVVISSNQDDIASKLAAVKVPTLVQPAAQIIEDSYSQINTIGVATGHPNAAAKLITDIQTKLSEIATKVGTTPRTYYYELEPDYYSVTSSTFVGKLLSTIGLTSIADTAGGASNGGYPKLSPEFILKANPDYVFLADTKCCQQSSASIGSRAGWSELGAVKNGHVVELDDDIASRWGPRVVDLLSTIADAISKK